MKFVPHCVFLKFDWSWWSIIHHAEVSSLLGCLFMRVWDVISGIFWCASDAFKLLQIFQEKIWHMKTFFLAASHCHSLPLSFVVLKVLSSFGPVMFTFCFQLFSPYCWSKQIDGWIFSDTCFRNVFIFNQYYIKSTTVDSTSSYITKMTPKYQR